VNTVKIFLNSYYILLFFTALLTACGGGSTQAANIAPRANAGIDQKVYEHAKVIEIRLEFFGMRI
jgi:hypothetical protein